MVSAPRGRKLPRRLRVCPYNVTKEFHNAGSLARRPSAKRISSVSLRTTTWSGAALVVPSGVETVPRADRNARNR